MRLILPAASGLDFPADLALVDAVRQLPAVRSVEVYVGVRPDYLLVTYDGRRATAEDISAAAMKLDARLDAGAVPASI